MAFDAPSKNIRYACRILASCPKTKALPFVWRVNPADDAGRFTVTLAGTPVTPDFELTKFFKFYYTDAEGNPDLSLAVARLIAETYGGELYAAVERDKVVLRLSLPLGAQ